jgi:hypothetical protein
LWANLLTQTLKVKKERRKIMKIKRTVLLLTVVVMMGLLLGASAAQAFTVEVDGTGTNATAILNLEVNGALYDVTFRFGTIGDIWGDEAFDFNQQNVAVDASLAVNDALNTVPAVETVGPQSENSYDIPFNRIGIFVDVLASAAVIGTGGTWSDVGVFPNVSDSDETYAQFTQTGSITPAPVPKTGQTESVLPGDDGDLQLGVTWPDPRFTDNGDGTVTDNLTGLIWLKNANCFNALVWADALQASNDLADGQCGLVDGSTAGDWRLPNIKELLSLIDYSNAEPALPPGDLFTGVLAGLYWSSTSVTTDVVDGAAWIMQVWYGLTFPIFTDRGADVWPVRGGND